MYRRAVSICKSKGILRALLASGRDNQEPNDKASIAENGKVNNHSWAMPPQGKQLHSSGLNRKLSLTDRSAPNSQIVLLNPV